MDGGEAEERNPKRRNSSRRNLMEKSLSEISNLIESKSGRLDRSKSKSNLRRTRTFHEDSKMGEGNEGSIKIGNFSKSNLSGTDIYSKVNHNDSSFPEDQSYISLRRQKNIDKNIPENLATSQNVLN